MHRSLEPLDHLLWNGRLPEVVFEDIAEAGRGRKPALLGIKNQSPYSRMIELSDTIVLTSYTVIPPMANRRCCAGIRIFQNAHVRD